MRARINIAQDSISFMPCKVSDLFKQAGMDMQKSVCAGMPAELMVGPDGGGLEAAKPKKIKKEGQ